MEYQFKKIRLGVEEKLWLSEAHRNPNVEVKILKARLWEKLPKGFDPRAIDNRLYRGSRLTLIGLWYIEPSSKIFEHVEKTLKKIREKILQAPGLKQVLARDLASDLSFSERDVEIALHYMADLGRFFSSASGYGDKLGYSALSLEGEDAYDAYLAFESLEQLMEDFFIARESSLSNIPYSLPPSHPLKLIKGVISSKGVSYINSITHFDRFRRELRRLEIAVDDFVDDNEIVDRAYTASMLGHHIFDWVKNDRKETSYDWRNAAVKEKAFLGILHDVCNAVKHVTVSQPQSEVGSQEVITSIGMRDEASALKDLLDDPHAAVEIRGVDVFRKIVKVGNADLYHSLKETESFWREFFKAEGVELKDVSIRKNALLKVAKKNDVISHASANLSSEAIDLLDNAAKDSHGIILRIETLGGTEIKTNGKLFGEPKIRRSIAQLDAAIDQLIAEGLINDRNGEGQIFEVSALGYKVADGHV